MTGQAIAWPRPVAFMTVVALTTMATPTACALDLTLEHLLQECEKVCHSDEAPQKYYIQQV